MPRIFCAILLCLGMGLVLPASAGGPAAGIRWQPWSDNIFQRATQEHRFVLLDLEAVWCHWCHVMDAETYSDRTVVALLGQRYIAVKVDQESRPDLSNRYEDYGWPATIIFGSNGTELVKRSGYIRAPAMGSLLQSVIDDPTPGPSAKPEPKLQFGDSTQLNAALRDELRKSNVDSYDFKHGSWGFVLKFLDWNSVEYALGSALHGDAQAQKMARQTLTAQMQLLDPAWGGVYQYSTDGDWNAPHYEKIMPMQAGNLRAYALAYRQWQVPADLHAAQEIQRYLKNFLTSPPGALYTSQDADLVQGEHAAGYFRLGDAQRRKQGIPRVDTHVYARENGWAIESLALLYASTGDSQYLDQALRAANWIVAHRAIKDGGFRHDERDIRGAYLGDTLAMGGAFLQLYGVSGNRQWLARAEAAADNIDSRFKSPNGAGYVTTLPTSGSPFAPRPLRDENIVLARFANLLFHYTGRAVYEAQAKQAMRYLATPAIARRLPVAGVLLADRELSSEPVHITVTGARSDAAAQALFHAAMRYPGAYLRLEWWDRREGRLPNPDVEYPNLPKAAAFLCTDRRCSSPAFTPDQLGKLMQKTFKDG